MNARRAALEFALGACAGTTAGEPHIAALESLLAAHTDQPATHLPAGQWVHCTPALLQAGVSCAHTPRRACDQCGHDHFIAHAVTEFVPGADLVERATLAAAAWATSDTPVGEALAYRDGIVAGVTATVPQPPAQADARRQLGVLRARHDYARPFEFTPAAGAVIPYEGIPVFSSADTQAEAREDAYVEKRMTETLASVYATIIGDDQVDESDGLNAIQRVEKAAQVLRLEVELYRAQADAREATTDEARDGIEFAIQVLRQVEAGDGTFVGQCTEAIEGLEAALSTRGARLTALLAPTQQPSEGHPLKNPMVRFPTEGDIRKWEVARKRQPSGEVTGWQPIETAPADTEVVVFWLDPESPEHPERYDFDMLDDGCWRVWTDHYEWAHSVAPAGSRMPREQPPYTHWKPLGVPTDAARAQGGDHANG
ncbi:hypothetical protein WM11_21780 [Burkholderia ubonensis]|nr:hypothetical protein WM11_21780 [Burkholderia ubonensis]KWK44251.1 hypothetical protein WM14_11900 [Burkholderia ubonensis]